MTYDIKIGSQIRHKHGCKRLDDKEMADIVDNFFTLVEPILEKQFNHFKSSNICVDDYLSVLLTIAGEIASVFITQAKTAHPKLDDKQHIAVLIKSLCAYFNMPYIDKRETQSDSPLH